MYTTLPEYPVDSPEWHEARRSSLGASEVAAVLGLSPWQTPLSVYMAKMGVRNDIPENLAYFGRALEPVIAQWITDTRPDVGKLRDGFSARCQEWPWLTVSPDRLVEENIPVELKTSSAFGRDKWAEGVPLFYQAQVQAQIAVLDAPYGWLAVLHGGNEPELYRVERDDDFIDGHLIPKTRAFWEDHVLANIPPEPTTYEEALAVYPGDPLAAYELTDAEYEALQQRDVDSSDMNHLKKRVEVYKEQVALWVGDATVLTYQGEPVYTYKRQNGQRQTDLARLESQWPEAYAACVTRPRHPVLRLIKKKETP